MRKRIREAEVLKRCIKDCEHVNGMLFSLFASCTEIVVLLMEHLAWTLLLRDGELIVACDREIMIKKIKKAKKLILIIEIVQDSNSLLQYY